MTMTEALIISLVSSVSPLPYSHMDEANCFQIYWSALDYFLKSQRTWKRTSLCFPQAGCRHDSEETAI